MKKRLAKPVREYYMKDGNSTATLFGRRFTLDRWNKRAMATGWIIGLDGTYNINASLGDSTDQVYIDTEPSSSDGEAIGEVREKGSVWNITLPLPAAERASWPSTPTPVWSSACRTISALTDLKTISASFRQPLWIIPTNRSTFWPTKRAV